MGGKRTREEFESTEDDYMKEEREEQDKANAKKHKGWCSNTTTIETARVGKERWRQLQDEFVQLFDMIGCDLEKANGLLLFYTRYNHCEYFYADGNLSNYQPNTPLLTTIIEWITKYAMNKDCMGNKHGSVENLDIGYDNRIVRYPLKSIIMDELPYSDYLDQPKYGASIKVSKQYMKNITLKAAIQLILPEVVRCWASRFYRTQKGDKYDPTAVERLFKRSLVFLQHIVPLEFTKQTHFMQFSAPDVYTVYQCTAPANSSCSKKVKHQNNSRTKHAPEFCSGCGRYTMGPRYDILPSKRSEFVKSTYGKKFSVHDEVHKTTTFCPWNVDKCPNVVWDKTNHKQWPSHIKGEIFQLMLMNTRDQYADDELDGFEWNMLPIEIMERIIRHLAGSYGEGVLISNED